MNNIIGELDYKMQHPMKDPDRIKEVHEKIEVLLEQVRPNPNDFRGVIPDAEIEDDLKKVRDLEALWNRVNEQEVWDIKRKSDIAEYIIYKNLGTWMDQKAVPLITAKPDDYLRGIDLVIESENNETNQDIEHLGIGIDVALVSEKGFSEAIEKKEKKVRQILKSGKLNEARYVSGGSYEGRIQNLPYIILSISPSHIEELFSSALVNHSTQKEQAHILKYIVAYQILRQLYAYAHLALQAGKNEVAREYAVANNFANGIFSHLMNEMQTNDDIKTRVAADAGVMELERFCADLQKQLT